MKNKTIFYILGGLLIASYIRAFMVAKKLGYDLNFDGWVYSLSHLDLYNENFERLLSGLEKVENPRTITQSENGKLFYQENSGGGGGSSSIPVATPYQPETTTPVVNVNISTDQEDETTTNDEVEGTEAPIPYVEERRPEGVYEVGTGETGRTAGDNSHIVTTNDEVQGTEAPTTYVEERRPEGVYEVGTGETGRTAGANSSIITTSETPETNTIPVVRPVLTPTVVHDTTPTVKPLGATKTRTNKLTSKLV